MSRLLPDPLYTDSTQEGGAEYQCAHCDDPIYVAELLERTYETRHVATDAAISADGTHEAEAIPL